MLEHAQRVAVIKMDSNAATVEAFELTPQRFEPRSSGGI